MRLTTNLKLKQPDYTDPVDIQDINDNMVIIDSEVSEVKDEFDTHLADKANPHNTNKSDVGLSDVTNDKQMPISGGVLENYTEKLETMYASTGSINLAQGNVFQHTPSKDMTYVITKAVSGQAYSFTLIINMGTTVRILTFPASVKWQGGEIPDMSTASKTYVLTFMTVNGGATWLGMFGGEF